MLDFVFVLYLQLDESGNPKESINIHSEDGDHAQNKPTKSSPMPATTLSATENLSANQVTSLPAEVNQDTLTVSLEGTGIVPDSDAGIAEVIITSFKAVSLFLNQDPEFLKEISQCHSCKVKVSNLFYNITFLAYITFSIIFLVS